MPTAGDRASVGILRCRMYGALVSWIAPESELPFRPRRILVAGTAGSGKSTLARWISRILEDVEYFEIDALYHGPQWIPNPRFVDQVDRRTLGAGWVTEWQYHTVRDLLADRADLLVWLDLPRHVVMRSVTARTVRRSLLGVELWNGNREPRLQTILHDPDHIIRAQLAFGAGSLIVADVGHGRVAPLGEEASQSVMLRVADVDSMCERVRNGGGEVVREPRDYPYGERQCTVRDPAGHCWTLTQTVQDVAPEDWGGNTVEAQ